MDTHAIIGKALGDKYAEAKRRRHSLTTNNIIGFMEFSHLLMRMIDDAYSAAFHALLDAGDYDAAGVFSTAFWAAVEAGEEVSV